MTSEVPLSPPPPLSTSTTTTAAGQPQEQGGELDWTPSPLDAAAAVASSSSYAYLAFSVAMVIGPVIGYIEQWRKMQQQRTSEGYSPAVSIILIACNTFRIVYYLGEPYALMLLWQSVVMLLVQLGLLVTVAKLNMAKRILQNAAIGNVGSEDPTTSRAHNNTNNASFSSKARSVIRACNPLNFTPSQLLLRYVFVLVSLLLLGSWIFSLSPVKGPTIAGYLSLGIEATLVTPQLLLNFQRRSTEGLSCLNMAKRILQNAAIGNVGSEDPTTSRAHNNTNNASFSSKARSVIRACNPLNFTPSQLLLRYVFVLVSLLLLGSWIFSLSPVKGPTIAGYLSLGIEATLVTPQLLLNFQRRSTEGLSWLLVVTWCVGDVVKMIFFVVESQPAPFVVCGTFQIGCDAIVLLQLWWYRDPLVSRRYGVHNVTDDETERMSEK
ncbi:transmembrane protein, putative [Bodo saltans]|uniref:Transmembrane protein, putative n=1 Tax=Bodo saltans TaxID=75058 RepID=A0A0S4JM63_BODSA|nr:transmembrane protein, putative [Bodo saltans]|eukprot:CUG90193.1 transmembrane protein, putative [Bodo saltans]